MSKAETTKLLLESLALAGSIFAYFKTRSKLRQVDQLIDFINRAYLFTPATFLEVLKEHSMAIFAENFIGFTENEHEVQVTGFFKGLVDTPKPIRSVLKKDRSLVASKLKAMPLYSNVQGNDGRDYVIKYNHADTFVLKDPRTVNSILVTGCKNCKNQMAFAKIAEKSEFRSFNWFEVIVTKVIWLIQLSLGILKIYPSFKGFLMGVRTTESGVELGQSILTFGSVRFDKMTQAMSMDNPLFLLGDKNQMSEFHLSERQKWGRFKSLSLLFTIVFSLMVIRRLVRVGRRLAEAVRIQVDKLKMRKMKHFTEALTDDLKCIICIECPKNVIFKPCLHMALCKTCYGGLPKQECPICKQKIASVVSVYLV